MTPRHCQTDVRVMNTLWPGWARRGPGACGACFGSEGLTCDRVRAARVLRVLDAGVTVILLYSSREKS